MSQDPYKQILEELAHIRQHMPNGELKRIEKQVDKLHTDITEIKKTLLDPNDGLIVETNKNTEWREERQKKTEYYDNKVHELEKIIEWKNGVSKALWIGFTAIAGIVLKLLADSIYR